MRDGMQASSRYFRPEEAYDFAIWTRSSEIYSRGMCIFKIAAKNSKAKEGDWKERKLLGNLRDTLLNNLILWCLQVDMNKRATIQQVVKVLHQGVKFLIGILAIELCKTR